MARVHVLPEDFDGPPVDGEWLGLCDANGATPPTFGFYSLVRIEGAEHVVDNDQIRPARFAVARVADQTYVFVEDFVGSYDTVHPEAARLFATEDEARALASWDDDHWIVAVPEVAIESFRALPATW
jgi:hypothetical protein